MAIRKDLVPHILTINGVQYGVDQAESDYTTIGDIVGIKKAPENSTVAMGMSPSELQNAGLVVRINCRLKNKKNNSLLCATDKLASALSGLKGKAMNGSTIAKASVPRKRSRR